MTSSRFQRGLPSSFLVSPVTRSWWSMATGHVTGCVILSTGLLLTLAMPGGGVSVYGDDSPGMSQDIGILAKAVEPDVARELQLESETVERLKRVISQQNGQVLSEDAENQGLELLTPVQQQHLHQILVRDQGMQSLRDAQVAQSLKLTDEQQAHVAQQWQVVEQTIERHGP